MQDPFAEPTSRLGQKYPAGQGLQLPLEVPPAWGGHGVGLYILWPQTFARATAEPGPNCFMELLLVGLPRATFLGSASGTAYIVRPAWGVRKVRVH